MDTALKIHAEDTVAVALQEIASGSEVFGVTARDTIPFGHKIALESIHAGSVVIKYGNVIGIASQSIEPGEHIHSHNLTTSLNDDLDYEWIAPSSPPPHQGTPATFMGYERPDGRVGVRNEVWVINTVGCVNMTAQRLVQQASTLHAHESIDGFFTFNHPFGCSQLGDDLNYTQRLLAGLIDHPNAAAVLVLGLGCENNQMRDQLSISGDIDSDRVHFFNAQDVEDEIEYGLEEIGALAEYARSFQRQELSADKLILAGKCGGSDAYSGIAANPLVGRVVDTHCAAGGTALITEVPEMFGAEHLLMKRAKSEAVFQEIGHLINDFKRYFRDHDQPISENPAPGNKAGGITTLEEKSLGCVQKGGHAPVCQVADYGERVDPAQGGLCLVNAPGNDVVSSTALAAAGAHIVMFTTGRGTPLGVSVPTLKISSNTELAARKKGWIDFDAGRLLSEGASLDDLRDELYAYVLRVASGEYVQNEINGYREIGIWKSGVTV